MNCSLHKHLALNQAKDRNGGLLDFSVMFLPVQKNFELPYLYFSHVAYHNQYFFQKFEMKLKDFATAASEISARVDDPLFLTLSFRYRGSNSAYSCDAAARAAANMAIMRGDDKWGASVDLKAASYGKEVMYVVMMCWRFRSRYM